jgi:uncharacterized membrane protein
VARRERHGGLDRSGRARAVSDFEPPGGVLGSVVENVLVGDVPEEEALESLKRLKGLLEPSQPVGEG